MWVALCLSCSGAPGPAWAQASMYLIRQREEEAAFKKKNEEQDSQHFAKRGRPLTNIASPAPPPTQQPLDESHLLVRER